jgi:hypothetical protein
MPLVCLDLKELKLTKNYLESSLVNSYKEKDVKTPSDVKNSEKTAEKHSSLFF